jgi:hypothetical protein
VTTTTPAAILSGFSSFVVMLFHHIASKVVKQTFELGVQIPLLEEGGSAVATLSAHR